MPARISLLIIIALIAVSAPAQEPPAPGDGPDAHLEWLLANPDSPAIATVLDQTLSIVTSLSHVDIIRARVLPDISNADLRWETARSLALVYRTARRFAEGAELFGLAYTSSGNTDHESLYSRAALLLELGDTPGADALARRVVNETDNYSLKRRAYTLVARTTVHSGDTDTARAMLETLAQLAEERGSPDVAEVESLLLLRQLGQEAGDDDLVRRAEDLIQGLFPESLAAATVAEETRLIVPASLPATLELAAITGGQPVGPAPVSTAASGEAASPRRDQPAVTAVQVGSFSDRENADHHAADLVKLGLGATVETINREGTPLHQVMIRIQDGSTEAAARVFATLNENGFDGFLVY